MKKPEVYKWLGFVERKKNKWKDWNNKQSYDYFIEIPEWLARAYYLERKKVIVNIYAKSQSFKQMKNKTTNDKYFKANWSKKQTKKRKLNHNYMKVELIYPKKECEQKQ